MLALLQYSMFNLHGTLLLYTSIYVVKCYETILLKFHI